jgi:uncharacterized membrane protein YcaP (DUF421 family)
MDTILHCVAGYFFLLLTVRVLTRRPGAQMTLFEFVIVFLIGGVIILATVGHDRSVTNCTMAVIAVGLLHRAVSGAKTKWPKLATVIDGKPLVLFKNGEWQKEAMRGMRLAPEDVLASARTKGVATFEQIQFAVLERNGGISIVKKEEE